ncbi:hypothetical protein D3C84_1002890 [compost metagenome]
MTSIEKAAFPQLLPQVRRCREGVKNVSVAGCETIRVRGDVVGRSSRNWAIAYVTEFEISDCLTKALL